VVLGARTAFFVARAARDLVAVARETLTNQEAHLRQTEGFVQVGTRPEIDLAQARTDRANAQVQLISAEAGYETAKAQLNQAMGVERTTEYEIGDDRLPPVDVEDSALDPLLEEALRARPEAAAFEAQVRQQEATLGASRSGYWPSLGVSTGLSEAGPALPDLTWNWNAQATLSWSLFAGGLTSAQVREAEATLESVKAQRDAFRLEVRLELEQARLAVRSAKSKLVAAGEALDNARQRLRLAEGRYQTGAGSIIELGDSQLALNAAAAKQVGADFDLATARARLLLALARP
jgi:outer membrane protein